MYWLRSSFSVSSLADLQLLQHIYKNVQGEVSVYSDKKKLIEVREWSRIPFQLSTTSFPVTLECRLDGPGTVKAVALPLRKNLTETEQKSVTPLHQEWADYIDRKVESEMKRKNDMGWSFPAPEENLVSMNDLVIAAMISKHATLVLPGKFRLIVTNPKSVYLSCISLDSKKDDFLGSLMFDKDDGFAELYPSATTSSSMKLLQQKFQEWSKKNFEGEFSSCFPEYQSFLLLQS